jgi:hypothetical protein
MKTLVTALCLVAVAVTPVAAFAQGTAADQRPAASTPQDLRRLHEYAGCVAVAQRQRARDLLAMDYREPAYEAAARRLYGPEPGCWRRMNENDRRAVQLRFNARMFAGRMAERLLREDLRGSTLAARVAVDPNRPAIQARGEEDVMSLCTVREAPAQVAAIFATEPASREEAAAIGAVTPQIGQCLVAGARGEFNRPAIRSMLALAAYRLVQHNIATPVSAGN